LRNSDVSIGYPILLDVTRLCVLIVGGGEVAARKAAGLLASGANDVRAVAPAFCQEFPAGVQRIIGRFEPEQFDGIDLAFAATNDSAVNDEVVREAHRRRVRINRADGSDQYYGDFTVPAMLRRGAITVAVSTDGSPALAATVRDHLAAALSPRWTELATLLPVVRGLIMSANLPANRRAEIFRDLASEAAAAALAADRAPGFWKWAQQRHAELVNLNLHAAMESAHRVAQKGQP